MSALKEQTLTVEDVNIYSWPRITATYADARVLTALVDAAERLRKASDPADTELYLGMLHARRILLTFIMERTQ